MVIFRAFTAQLNGWVFYDLKIVNATDNSLFDNNKGKNPR